MDNDKKKPGKGWTARRRKQQACNARRNKPWTKSTGPKSAKGKEAVRMNALKHGRRAASLKAFKEGLRLQREFLKHVMAYAAAERLEQEILANKRSEGKSSENKGDTPPP